MLSEEYSTLSPKQKEIRDKIAKDKGDRILILTEQLKELERDLPLRLEERERLEKEISLKAGELKKLNETISIKTKEAFDAEVDLSSVTKKMTDINIEIQQKKDSIGDLDKKIEERNILAREIKTLKEEESGLKGSIATKEIELRTLQVKINPLEEWEDRLNTREFNIKQREKIANEKLSEAERKYEDTAKINRDMTETKRIIDLNGKSMGHYIRGVQKHLDDKGIKLDFIKLLDELNK